ncbi:hypothetical protein ACFSTC_38180 [Nonomuraea ferruginea]
MRINRTTQLLAAAVLGVALAGVGVAGPAVADDDPEQGIDVTVTIEPGTTPGQVSMTVADNGGVSLQEDGSNAAARQFVGTLPTVTVNDTRRPEEIPAGDFWAVVGQAERVHRDERLHAAHRLAVPGLAAAPADRLLLRGGGGR